MQGNETPQAQRFSLVALLCTSVLTVLLVVMLARVAQLQLAPGAQLRELMDPRVSTREDLPLRGDILDRRGRLLASTQFARRIVLDPTIFLTQENADEALRRLAEASGIPEAELRERLEFARAENALREEIAKAWPESKERWRELVERRAEAAKARARAQAGVPDPAEGPAPQAEVPDGVAVGADGSAPGSGAVAVAPEPAPIVPARSTPTHAVPPLSANDPFAMTREAAEVAATGIAELAQVEQAAPPPELTPPGAVRYLPVGGVLSDEAEQRVRALMVRPKEKDAPRRLVGISLERVQERSLVGGPEVAGVVGLVGFGHVGTLGAERRLEEELAGESGRVAYLRDGSGRPLWIEPGFIVPPQHGKSVRLSIDLEHQRIAFEEITRQVEHLNAAGGRLVMIRPQTGEVLAMVDVVRTIPEAVPFPFVPIPPKGQQATPLSELVRPNQRFIAIAPDARREQHPALGRNRCVEDIYEPGSTFKPFVWAVVTELGRARLDEVFDTENGKWTAPDGRYLQDVTARSTMTWPQVLINSSNIGMVKAAQRLEHRELHDMVRRFGFGERTNIGLPGETGGRVTALRNWKNYTQVSVAYGHEIAATPLQMVRAFTAFARTGPMAGTLPTLRLTSPEPDEAAPVSYRVIPPHVADATRLTLASVSDVVEQRWMKDETPEGGWRYSMFGKSGTALIPVGAPPPGMRRPAGAGGYLENQFISSFLAGAPVEDPQLVIIVTIDDPAPAPGRARAARYGSAAAGPVVRRVLERSLTYMGVPASPRPEGTPVAGR